MRRRRSIIEIDEELCDGCGQCIVECAEGALALVNGRVRLVGEVLCDGLGACIGECPTGALKVVVREADDFDERAVKERLHRIEAEMGASASHAGCPHAVASHIDETSHARAPSHDGPATALPSFGCQSAREMEIDRGTAHACSCADGDEDAGPVGPVVSELGHWPIKLTLLRPDAPFLQGADLLLLADCVGVSYPALHGSLLKGRAVAIGCPKLDDLDQHINKLSDVLKASRLRSLTVGYMEVPCCRGFVYAAEKAIEESGVRLPLKAIKIGISGDVQREEELGAECGCACSMC